VTFVSFTVIAVAAVMLDRVDGMREIDISASVLDCGTVTLEAYVPMVATPPRCPGTGG
jgi:hypothetical protein